MSNELTENEEQGVTVPPESPAGVRPLLKIGGKLNIISPKGDGEKPLQAGGDWAFEYRPGEKNMSVLVRSDGSIFLSVSPIGEMSMNVDSQGIDDLIAWLYGVKNSIVNA